MRSGGHQRALGPGHSDKIPACCQATATAPPACDQHPDRCHKAKKWVCDWRGAGKQCHRASLFFNCNPAIESPIARVLCDTAFIRIVCSGSTAPLLAVGTNFDLVSVFVQAASRSAFRNAANAHDTPVWPQTPTTWWPGPTSTASAQISCKQQPLPASRQQSRLYQQQACGSTLLRRGLQRLAQAGREACEYAAKLLDMGRCAASAHVCSRRRQQQT